MMVRGQNEAAQGGGTRGALEVRERTANAATFILAHIPPADSVLFTVSDVSAQGAVPMGTALLAPSW